jgi:hypothetical protein
MFALLIGIDMYQNVRQLTGAVEDVMDMASYLREHLNVEAANIRSLINTNASQKQIIQAFEDIRQDARIRQGDCIIIFFAGHGRETTAPAGWASSKNKIQLILPYDFKPTAGGTAGIPDFKIAALINRIAMEKGNNIASV